MPRRISYFLALGVCWSKLAFAQWQAVPSPADRVFALVQGSAGIIAGSENSGLWMSTNGGASFAIYPTGLPELAFDVRGFARSDDTLWAGTFGGGVCRSADGGTTWSSFNSGFQTQPFVIGVEQIKDTVYAAVAFLPGMQPSGVYKTSIRQANWKRSGTGISEDLAGLTCFAVTESGAMFVGAALSGARGNLRASIDNGQTWLDRRITGVADVFTLEAEGNLVYAGTSDGIYLTRDDAETWQRLGAQFYGSVVDDILIFNGVLFAAVDGVGVVHSTNGGANWNIITGNLPIAADYVNALAVHGGKVFASLSAAHGVWSTPLPTTEVDENKNVPRVAMLEQNYPNPFNPGTTIAFHLPQAERVSLKVYNVLGNEVAILLDHERKAAGKNTALLHAEHLASGYYFYRLTAGSFTETRKMLLIR